MLDNGSRRRDSEADEVDSRGNVLVKNKRRKHDRRLTLEVGEGLLPGIKGNVSVQHKRKKLEERVEHKRRKLERRVEVRKQLLPGILDEITIALIAPKLPWTAFHMLSSVSRCWLQAIRTHQVYDARVRSQSTQTFVVIDSKHVSRLRPITLCSLIDGTSHHLPPFPNFNGSGVLPWSCQCVSLDGKFYVMGGVHAGVALAAVYVLDLAGQRKWERCASMKDPRAEFASGVINGKIYVFGGRVRVRDCVYGSEVYDPKADAWSTIAPMRHFGSYREVITMGDELLVHNAHLYNDDWYYQPPDPVIKRGRFAEVYNPLKNEWRIMDHFVEDDREILVMVRGKLYKMTSPWLGTDVYDPCAMSWNLSQSFSFGVLGPTYSFRVQLLAAVAVNDELLAVARCIKLNGIDTHPQKICLMRSQGLGCQTTEIVWKETQCSLRLEKMESRTPLLGAIIQL